MRRIEKEDVSVGSGILVSYQRMPQKLERVFAEFIDNSTQSYIDHVEELKKISKNSVCRVNITWSEDKIVISDRSFGMNRDDFRRALKLNSPKDEYSDKSRSQFGMGLKIAAAFLGNWYSIESTQLGSNEKYYSVVDLDEWKKTNPLEIDNIIEDVSESEHYTIITIKKLTQKFTNSVDKNLRKKLSIIYEKDLSEGQLELTLNGIPIEKADPILWVDDDTNSEYYASFYDEFIYDGQTYSYNGWIGILEKASTDDAGFTLSQYGRGIMLNYRPSEIFGKSNSFCYQRVVGEIELDDEKWEISFNKDGFTWEDALEKAFIKSVKSLQEVTRMVTIASKLRKKNKKKPIIDNKDAKKTAGGLKQACSGLDEAPDKIPSNRVSDEPIVKLEDEENATPNIVPVRFEGIDYTFDIQIKNDDPDLGWLTLQKKEGENCYYIIINGAVDSLSEFNKKECKDLIFRFAIGLVLAQLSGVRLGIDKTKSAMFIQQFNNIIKYMKPKGIDE